MKKGLIFLSIICIYANSLLAQQGNAVLISETFDEVNLVQVLKTLKSKYGLQFAYDNQLLKKAIVKKDISALNLEATMLVLLEGTDLDYEVINGTIVVKPKISATGKDERHSISGIVRDKATGETLPHTTLYIQGTNIGVSTNVDGFFSILNVPADTCSLVVNYLGYKEEVIELLPHLKNRIPIEVSMSNVAELLDEVIINESNSQIVAINDEPSAFRLNPSKLASLPNLGELDIFRSLQLFPGISATNETSSGLIIRGSPSGQNLILFDGFSLYHIDHFFGIFSAINSSAVKDVQVHKGGFEAKYGGRVSGVVDITGKSGNQRKPSFGLGLNMLSGNAVLELPIGNKVTLFGAVRRAYTDVLRTDLYTKLFNKVIFTNVSNEFDAAEIKPDFHFYDQNSKITFQPNDKNLLSFSVYSGKDDLNLVFSREFENGFARSIEENVWGNTGFGFRWASQWSDKHYSNLKIGRSNFFSDFNQDFYLEFVENKTFYTFSEKYVRENDLNDFTASFDNELILNEKNRLEFGASFTRNKILLKDFFEGEDFQNYTENGQQFGVYLQNTFKPFASTSITLGLRNNYYDVTSKNYLEPKVSVIQTVNNKLKLKAAWGKNNQMIVKVFDSDVFSNAPDFWYMADGEIVPIASSQHVSGGFLYENNGWLVDMEAYYKNTKGVVEFLTIYEDLEDVDYSGGVFVKGGNVSKGIDLLVSKNIGKYNGWISYTLGKVDSKFPGLNQNNSFSSKFDQRHELKLVNTFSAGKWDLSSTWVYGSGRPYSSPEDMVTNYISDSLNVDYVAIENINSRRLPAYHRLDLSATYNLDFKASKAQLGLSLHNVYGRKNIKNRRFTLLDFTPKGDFEPVGDTRYAVSDVVLLEFTPNIFFNLRF